MRFVYKIISDGVVHPVLEVDVQLVFECVSPMLFVSQVLNGFLEIRAQKALSYVQTLKLLHRLDLLHPPLSRVFQSLVLLLDPFDDLIDQIPVDSELALFVFNDWYNKRKHLEIILLRELARFLMHRLVKFFKLLLFFKAVDVLDLVLEFRMSLIIDDI